MEIDYFSQYQHPNYAQIEIDFDNYYGIFKDNQLHGVFRGNKREVSVLKNIPLVGKYELVIRRSFYYPQIEFETINFTRAVKGFMKKEKISLFSLSPTNFDDNFDLQLPAITKLKCQLIQAGWEHNRPDDMTGRISYYEQAVIVNYKTFNEVQKTFKKDTMRKVRKAKKVGVSIKEISADDLISYYYLFQDTGKRDQFKIQEPDFYKSLVNTFEGDAKIYVSSLNLEDYLLYIKNNQPDRTDIIKNIESINKKTIDLGLAICLDTNRQSYYQSGATSNLFRETMHNYLLHHHAIEKAYDNKRLIYNFGGVNGGIDKEKDPLYKFKSRFGPHTLAFNGEFIMYSNKFEAMVLSSLKKIKR